MSASLLGTRVDIGSDWEIAMRAGPVGVELSIFEDGVQRVQVVSIPVDAAETVAVLMRHFAASARRGQESA